MAESAPSRPPLALIASDQEWSIRSLESILAPHGYAIVRAYNGQQAIDLAHDTSPDLIVVDAHFPDLRGVDVCRTLRKNPLVTSWTPILITTAGPRTRQLRLEARSAGAWDLLGLPLDAEEFLLRLDSLMKLKLEADRLQEESLVDAQTGLYNLRGLMRRVRELGSDAYRHGRPFACVAFAPRLASRPTFGHEGRDEALRIAVDGMAQVFRTAGRISDAIGRVRLGEFAVIAPGTNEAGALKLAQRMAAALEAAIERAGASVPLAILAGYDAVENLRESEARPSALLAAATTAVRRSQAEPGGPTIRRYTQNSEVSFG